MLPQELGCGSGMTCWRRVRDWQHAGVWDLIHFALLDWLARGDQIDWSRAVVDSCSIRAVYGGDQTGPNPTDRAKRGSKRHLICDGRGVPLAVRLTGANRRLARSFGVGGCDSPAARRTRATATPAGLCPRGSRLRRDGDSAWAAGASHRALPGDAPAPRMGVAWGRGGGSWSAPLPGSVSFAACECGMTSGPTFTRRSSRSGER
jgi:transposase